MHSKLALMQLMQRREGREKDARVRVRVRVPQKGEYVQQLLWLRIRLRT